MLLIQLVLTLLSMLTHLKKQITKSLILGVNIALLFLAFIMNVDYQMNLSKSERSWLYFGVL